MKTLSIAYLNVRSLLPHFADLKNLLLEKSFDILGISETWLTQGIPSDHVQVPGYTFLRTDRDMRGGGVGMYFKNNFKYEVLTSKQSESLEQLWIKFKFNNVVYIFGSIYRPPKGHFLDFMNEFENALKCFTMECEKLVCVCVCMRWRFQFKLFVIGQQKRSRF